MAQGMNAVEAKLSEALDALTAAVLGETLEELRRATDELQKDGRIALSGKASYVLSRPRFFEKFKLMLTDRLVQRYPTQKKRALERAERERPRLKIDRRRGSVAFLDFRIGGTPEDIAKELGASRPPEGVAL